MDFFLNVNLKKLLKFWEKMPNFQNYKIGKKKKKKPLVETFDESYNVQKLVLGPNLFQIK
jgi:hypothetical protein